MNQDQLKEKLDKYTENKDFTVIFSGKISKRIDSLYHPEKQEIIIHNKNFVEENSLMYTALHELVHHIDFTSNRGEIKRNAHGGQFWTIFHEILEKAIENGDYKEFEDSFLDAAIEINKEHTKLLKRFGKSLIDLMDRCQQTYYPFEDLVHRKLSLKPGQAKDIMSVYIMDVSEEIGGEFSKKVAKIKDPEKRKEAEEKGEIPVKFKEPEDERAEAERNLRRIEKQIENLQRKKIMYEEQLQGYEDAEELYGD